MHVRISVAAVILSLLPAVLCAQNTPPPAAAPPMDQRRPEPRDPDARLDPLQPDFSLAALPTTLRMPAGGWSFRVTHRFTRDLGAGGFGDAAANLFGLDDGSQVGLEVRRGLRPGTQIGIHRTSDRSIQLFVQQNLMTERDAQAVGLDLIATLEGADNLSEHHRSAVGVAASKTLGTIVAVYVEPLVVFNTNPSGIGDRHTMMVGLGGRLRLRPTTYLMAEWTPRVAGFSPFADQITVALERRRGGHLFQVNVGNGFGTTFGQLAAGGVDYGQWYLGFNIARKFF